MNSVGTYLGHSVYVETILCYFHVNMEIIRRFQKLETQEVMVIVDFIVSTILLCMIKHEI